MSIATAAQLIKTLGAVIPTTSADKLKHIKAIQDLSNILAGARGNNTTTTSTLPPTTLPLVAQRVAAAMPTVVTV